MDLSALTTSSITNLINQYKANEQQRRIQPMLTKISKYKNSSSAYGTLSSKLDSLKTVLAKIKETDTDSIFISKKASLSNSSFLSATATSSASIGASSLRVNQLAKSDIAVSQDIDTSTAGANSLGLSTGTYSFMINTGDGSTGEYTSKISVDIDGTDSNSSVLEKIKDAVNADEAVVESNTVTGAYAGGTTSFKINLNGTETTITDSTATTYEELIDNIVSQISSDVAGVTAEKVTNGSDFQLKLTVDDASNYISITHDSGFDLVSDLGISATKEKGAAGIVDASVFSAVTGSSQLSFTSSETGLDYRIKNISDSSGNLLDSIGLNLGSSRPSFDQDISPNTAGFIYSDITAANNQLNSKLTFNGLSVQRNTNTIDDLVSGVTFSLKSIMSDTDDDVNLTVGNDIQSIRSDIESFVTKFNDIYSYIKNNSMSSNGVRGAFLGDSTATGLRTKLGNLAYSEVSGLTGDSNFNKLSSIGITFTSTSGLSITDSSLLDESLTNSIDEVESLFNSTNGIANQFYDLVEPYLESDGYLANIKNSYESNVTYLNDKVTSSESQIDKSSLVLRSRYEDMQKQVLILLNSQSLYNSIASSQSTGFF